MHEHKRCLQKKIEEQQTPTCKYAKNRPKKTRNKKKGKTREKKLLLINKNLIHSTKTQIPTQTTITTARGKEMK